MAWYKHHGFKHAIAQCIGCRSHVAWYVGTRHCHFVQHLRAQKPHMQARQNCYATRCASYTYRWLPISHRNWACPRCAPPQRLRPAPQWRASHPYDDAWGPGSTGSAGLLQSPTQIVPHARVGLSSHTATAHTHHQRHAGCSIGQPGVDTLPTQSWNHGEAGLLAAGSVRVGHSAP